jgi:hypothetical protein
MPEHPHGDPQQPDRADAPFTEHQVMVQALEELLIEKGIPTPDDIRQGIDRLDALK